MCRQRLLAQGLGRLAVSTLRDQFTAHLVSLDTLLASRPWLVGELKSIADIAVSAQLDEIVRTSADASDVVGFPRIAEWLARCT
jgi:glutathione S-transferase